MQIRKTIELNIPELVNAADKPPLLGGEVKSIPVSELEKRANFKWTESLHPTQKTIPHAQAVTNLTEETASKIYQVVFQTKSKSKF